MSRLLLALAPPLHLVHGPLPGEQVGGVPAPEARLHVEHRHVPPAGRVAVGGGVGAGGAGLALDQLEEGLHVGAQPGHQAGPHRRHRLLVAGLQRLQQRAVVPAAREVKGVTEYISGS